MYTARLCSRELLRVSHSESRHICQGSPILQEHEVLDPITLYLISEAWNITCGRIGKRPGEQSAAVIFFGENLNYTQYMIVRETVLEKKELQWTFTNIFWLLFWIFQKMLQFCVLIFGTLLTKSRICFQILQGVSLNVPIDLLLHKHQLKSKFAEIISLWRLKQWTNPKLK